MPELDPSLTLTLPLTLTLTLALTLTLNPNPNPNFLQESVEGMEEAAGFHPLTHLSHRAGEGCQVSGGVLISRVPGSLRFSAQSPQVAHRTRPTPAATLCLQAVAAFGIQAATPCIHPRRRTPSTR